MDPGASAEIAASAGEDGVVGDSGIGDPVLDGTRIGDAGREMVMVRSRRRWGMAGGAGGVGGPGMVGGGAGAASSAAVASEVDVASIAGAGVDSGVGVASRASVASEGSGCSSI